MYTFHGVKSSGGIAIGPVEFVDHGTIGLHRIVCDPYRERAIYEAAIVLAKDELRRLQQRAHGADADILIFQIALLEDESFTNEIGDYIAAGAGSAAAVERAEQIFARRLQNVDSDYIRARSVDVRDACRRVVDILDGRPRRRVRLTQPSILVADYFFPSDIFSLDPKMILGFASDKGSVTSHASIMARNMGVPAIACMGDGMAIQSAGEMAILDADNETLIINPTPVQLAEARVRINRWRLAQRIEDPSADLPSITRDGVDFRIYSSANVSADEDISNALRAGAAGFGLVRTEYLMMAGASEEEQVQRYNELLASAHGRMLSFRNYDPTFDENERWDKLLEDRTGGRRFDQRQIKALLRAAVNGPMQVAVSGINTLRDWDACMAEIEEAKADLRNRGENFRDGLRFGCLVSRPSAALLAGELVEHGAGFLAMDIGNLACSTCGFSRDDPDYRVDDPAVMNLVSQVVREASQRRVRVGVLGITPIDIPAMVTYLRAGVHTFCTENACVIPLKNELRSTYIR